MCAAPNEHLGGCSDTLLWIYWDSILYDMWRVYFTLAWLAGLMTLDPNFETTFCIENAGIAIR
jgi:hypothetical protein